MSNQEETATETPTENNEVFQLSDDLISVIRELIQLSLLTGTNIVDHFRAIQVEIDGDTKKLLPTVEYVNAYNAMVQQLIDKAEAMQNLQAQEEGQLDLGDDDDGESGLPN